MKRWKVISLIAGLAIAWPVASYAQDPNRPLKRVGVLVQIECPRAEGNWSFIFEKLRWIAGQNFVFDCVSTVGRLGQLPALARELASRRPDVLIAGSWTFVRALKQETTTIPIVMFGTWEPVRLGLITSLAQPGGNITGVASFSLLSKQMELLKEIVPHMMRVAYMGDPPPLPPEASKIVDEYLTSAASTLGFTWQVFRPAVTNDYDEIFARLAAEHFDAAYIPSTPFNNNNQMRICQLALRHRIPAVSDEAIWANAGLLLNYGLDTFWSARRTSEYVDKILRGAKPSELPVEQATIELVVNLQTAKILGLTVPPSLIARADEVIE
jgi:putative ABC transport system substrate-binding protein